MELCFCTSCLPSWHKQAQLYPSNIKTSSVVKIDVMHSLMDGDFERVWKEERWWLLNVIRLEIRKGNDRNHAIARSRETVCGSRLGAPGYELRWLELLSLSVLKSQNEVSLYQRDNSVQDYFLLFSFPLLFQIHEPAQSAGQKRWLSLPTFMIIESLYDWQKVAGEGGIPVLGTWDLFRNLSIARQLNPSAVVRC